MVADGKIVNRRSVDFRPFARAARLLAADRKAWIETGDLLADLVRNAREPIPEVVLGHLRTRLDGNARKRRGRGRRSPSRDIRNMLITLKFEAFETWLDARQNTHGIDGWSAIRHADWWQGPPSERAARMARRRWAPSLGWERVRNIGYLLRKNGLTNV